MKLISKVLPSNFNLFCFGDDHEGTVLRDDSGWQQLVDMMNSPYGDLPASRNFGIDHGDCVEAICTDDSRFSSCTTKETSILAQAEQAVLNRQPIRKKIITILKGNHDSKLHRIGLFVRDTICKKLKVEYGSFSCVLTYKNKKDQIYFKHYAAHGKGSIKSTADDPTRQKSNMLLILKRKLKNKMGDCLLMSMGHTHKLLRLAPNTGDLYMASDELGLTQNYRVPVKDDEYIHPDHRWYLNTGSFHKTITLGIDSYAEEAFYDPVQLGFHIVRVRNREIEGVNEIKV